MSFADPGLAAWSQVQVTKARASVQEEPGWRLQGAKPLSSKSDAGPEKQRPFALQEKTVGHWIQEGPLAASWGACLGPDSSPPPSVPPPLQRPPPPRPRLGLRLIRCKRKGKSTWKAETLSPGVMVSRGKSESCQDPEGNGDSVVLAGSPLPEDDPSAQTSFQPGGREHSSWPTDQEGPPSWSCRTYLKTPVYSGPLPARLLPNSPQQGRFAEPDRPRKTHCQGAVALAAGAQENEPGKQEGESRPQPHTGKPPHTQTEGATALQLQEPPEELRLQALRARIQGAQAKKSQGRQTKMMAFPAQAPSPGEQAGTGPGGAASSKRQSLQEASAHGPSQKAPCLQPLQSSQDRNKTQTKRPAPLMAKALRDYKNRLSRYGR